MSAGNVDCAAIAIVDGGAIGFVACAAIGIDDGAASGGVDSAGIFSASTTSEEPAATAQPRARAKVDLEARICFLLLVGSIN